jgi:hypothetical protein
MKMREAPLESRRLAMFRTVASLRPRFRPSRLLIV